MPWKLGGLSSSSVPWALIYSVDFSALPTQTFNSNGVRTIDGLTWTTANYTAASSFSLTLGTGIRIVTPTLSWDTATRTSAYIRADVKSFLGTSSFATNPSTNLRIEWKASVVGTPTSTAGRDFLRAGMGGLLYYSDHRAECLYGHNGSVVGTTVSPPSASTYFIQNASPVLDATFGFTPNCFAIEYLSGGGTLYYVANSSSLAGATWTLYNATQRTVLARPYLSSSHASRQIFFFTCDKLSSVGGISEVILSEMRVLAAPGVGLNWFVA